MQCNASPFLQPPLLPLLGYIPTAHAEPILTGTFQPPAGTPYYARLLLNHIRYPSDQPDHLPPASHIDLLNHCASWKHAKEYTTAGISGVHFGMYKAQIRDPDLALYDAAHRSIPYHNGFYYDRWLRGVDVMLLKASGNTRSDKLRTILLMEADFNMNNKKLS